MKILPEPSQTVTFTLDAGIENAYRRYLILIGCSCVYPGTPLPGYPVLPLNWDAVTDLGLIITNTAYLWNFYATLDGFGKATALFNTLNADLPEGLMITFAFLLLPPPNYDFVSNPVKIEVTAIHRQAE